MPRIIQYLIIVLHIVIAPGLRVNKLRELNCIELNREDENAFSFLISCVF